jgi:orotate phosphoribosyltransferase
MQVYQREFIEFCLAQGALKFGEFKLKSGRISPYFFNAGMFKDGQAFLQLAKFYAAAIQKNFAASDYDLLFGPAYKGITLATVASMGLAEAGINIPVCFNRKEKKDHGEGGMMIGEPLKGKRALLIDDVITAGTTIREAVEIAQREQGTLAGIVIALNRQEVGLNSKLSAIQEVEQQFKLKVATIITLTDLIEYLKLEVNEHLPMMLAYQKHYGV